MVLSKLEILGEKKISCPTHESVPGRSETCEKAKTIKLLEDNRQKYHHNVGGRERVPKPNKAQTTKEEA